MGLFVMKWVVGCAVAWLIWDTGYKRGKGDLWEFLARNYIVLPKGSYSCGKEKKCVCKRGHNGKNYK